MCSRNRVRTIISGVYASASMSSGCSASVYCGLPAIFNRCAFCTTKQFVKYFCQNLLRFSISRCKFIIFQDNSVKNRLNDICQFFLGIEYTCYSCNRRFNDRIFCIGFKPHIIITAAVCLQLVLKIIVQVIYISCPFGGYAVCGVCNKRPYICLCISSVLIVCIKQSAKNTPDCGGGCGEYAHY